MIHLGVFFKDRLLLNDDKKHAIRNYKYTGEDQSFFAPFMYKLWSIFFILVPKRISPNLVTLFGLFFVVLAFGIIQLNGHNDDDGFNCLIFAIALFVYQTADALDGMQGKRVQMYENATTEIFDHGVDSMVTSLTSIATITRLTHIDQHLPPIYSALILLTSFIGFHSPTYEHVVTRKMRFQSGPCNPTEALIGMQLAYLITAAYPSLWHYETSQMLLMYIIIPALSLLAVSSLISSMNQIYLYHNGVLSQTIKSVFRGYSPLFSVLICASLYVTRLSNFYAEHPLMCLFAITIPWNYSIYRTIIIEITNDKHFDTFGVLIGQSPIIIPILALYFSPSLLTAAFLSSIMLSGILYVYTIQLTLKEVCRALSMEHFWTVKQDWRTKTLHQQIINLPKLIRMNKLMLAVTLMLFFGMFFVPVDSGTCSCTCGGTAAGTSTVACSTCTTSYCTSTYSSACQSASSIIAACSGVDMLTPLVAVMGASLIGLFFAV